MSEANLWHDVREALTPFGRLCRVENMIDRGTPDVLYTLSNPRGATRSGLLELKHIDEWPKNSTTPIRIRGLSLDQVLWIERWCEAGGRAGVLLRVGGRRGHHVMMPHGMTRSVFEGLLTRDDIFRIGQSSEGFLPGRLLRWLTD